MNKNFKLILALLIIAVISVSIVTAENTSDSVAIDDDSSDDAVSQDISIDKDSNDVKEKATKDIKDDENSKDVKEKATKDVKKNKLSEEEVVVANSFTIKKVWEDNDDKAGKRPDSVTVNVSINEDPLEPIVLNEKNGWKEEVTGVDEGASIDIQEEPVEGYTTEITGNEKDGYTITNTLEEEDDNETAVDDDDTTGDDTSDDAPSTTSTPKEKKVVKKQAKKTTSNNNTKAVKKQPKKVKDKNKAGNPILLGMLAVTTLGVSVLIRKE